MALSLRDATFDRCSCRMQREASTRSCPTEAQPMTSSGALPWQRQFLLTHFKPPHGTMSPLLNYASVIPLDVPEPASAQAWMAGDHGVAGGPP
eukprot:8298379-Prorocentrum_lima.AAC.1